MLDTANTARESKCLKRVSGGRKVEVEGELYSLLVKAAEV